AIFFETAKDYFLETFREYKATKNERFSPSQYGIYKQQLQKLAGLEELQYKCYKEKAQTALNVFEPDQRSLNDTVNTITEILRNARPNLRQINDTVNIMPLKDHDLQKLIDVINNNIRNATHGKDISKEHYQFLVCGGTAGIGKTRLGLEVFNILQHHWTLPTEWSSNGSVHTKYLRLDFGNDVILDVYDYDISASIIIGIRMAYEFFIKGKYDIQFREFRHEALKNKDNFNIDFVITAIRSSLCLETGQRLFLFIHIDEFQKIINFDGWNADTEKPSKGLFRCMMYELGRYMTYQSPQCIFVQTFLSGTEPHSIIRANEPTSYSWYFAECPLLSMAARIQIMEHFVVHYDSSNDWKLKMWIHQLLSDTGGLPRALEYLLEHFFGVNYDWIQWFLDEIDKHNPNNFFNGIAFDLNKRLTWALIHYCIGLIPVMKTDILSQEYPGETFEVLECDRHLVLKYRGENKYVVQMPLIFLYLYNQVLHMATNILDGIFTPHFMLQWQDWECFVAEFEAFHNNVLIELGKEVQSLREIYRGAYGHKNTLELRIKLRPLTVRRIREQFPCLKLSDSIDFNEVDWKSNSIIINGWAAPFADCFRCEITDDEHFLFICSQQKWKTNTICIEDILAEHEKNIKAFGKAQEPLRSEFKKYRLITVVFTNQPFSGNFANIPLNCLLICQQNFQDYFGHVFASRAAFAITRDSNPNFINPDRLCATLKIPKKLSGEISRKRPFRSRNEIIEKIPEMQSHLDAVKMMSFFPYGDDVRALDSPAKKQHTELYYNIECQRMCHTNLNDTDKENLWLQ
ncbi:19615_t:CDS:2, partial [Entrophospora sp. SA101]